MSDISSTDEIDRLERIAEELDRIVTRYRFRELRPETLDPAQNAPGSRSTGKSREKPGSVGYKTRNDQNRYLSRLRTK